MKFLDFLDSLPRFFILLISVLMIAIIGTLDNMTGNESSFLIFYFVPIFLGTWYIGTGMGIALSCLSTIAWITADKVFSQFIHSFAPYWNSTMYLGCFVGATGILTILKNSLEQEKRLARTDPMTGAINRRFFIELAQAELERSRRYCHPFTAAYIDLDNFKTINDTLGHDSGDELLILVVKTIKNQIRSTDVIARLGGDEFMVLFPETEEKMALAAIQKIRTVLLELMQIKNWPVTLSVGMITFFTPPDSVDHIIKLTDDLMYEGKKSGKNMIIHNVYENTACEKQAEI
ncbi:MAG: GGDEF domain-containing protein [Nitrospirota bacterium]